MELKIKGPQVACSALSSCRPGVKRRWNKLLGSLGLDRLLRQSNHLRPDPCIVATFFTDIYRHGRIRKPTTVANAKSLTGNMELMI